MVPCGGRLDLLAFANARLTTALPGFAQFTVQLTGGTDQKLRRRSAFLQYAVPSEALSQKTRGRRAPEATAQVQPLENSRYGVYRVLCVLAPETTA